VLVCYYFFLYNLVDVPLMRFSALLCCSSANLKKTHSESEIQGSRKSLVPVEFATTLTYPISTRQESKSSVTSKKPKSEAYTPQLALELFSTYADADTPDIIGLEGFETLCKDTEMSLEGARPLIFSWQMQAKEMGKISKDDWVQGMATLKVGSISGLSLAMRELEDLLFNGKLSKSTGKEYDRTSYNTYASNPKAAFRKLYIFSFNLVKPEQSKNIDMETSLAFWAVLLIPKYELMGEITQFIKENQLTYKATNKDLWSMMLEFCETVKPSLQDYEADGAWPTLLDDFVVWKSRQLKGANGADEKMDVSAS